MVQTNARERAREPLDELVVGEKALDQVVEPRLFDLFDQLAESLEEGGRVDEVSAREVGWVRLAGIDFRQFLGDDLNIALKALGGSLATNEIAVDELSKQGLGRVPKPTGNGTGAIGQEELQVEDAVLIRTKRFFGYSIDLRDRVVFFDSVHKKSAHSDSKSSMEKRGASERVRSDANPII